MNKTIQFKDLDGWLKFLVVMGWINIGLSALGMMYVFFEMIYLL